eukprot:UN07478
MTQLTLWPHDLSHHVKCAEKSLFRSTWGWGEILTQNYLTPTLSPPFGRVASVHLGHQSDTGFETTAPWAERTDVSRCRQ